MPMPISEPQSPTIQLDPEEAKLHRQLMDLAGGFWPLGKPTPLGSTMDGPVSAGTLNLKIILCLRGHPKIDLVKSFTQFQPNLVRKLNIPRWNPT
jgi:hypothetical protein